MKFIIIILIRQNLGQTLIIWHSITNRAYHIPWGKPIVRAITNRANTNLGQTITLKMRFLSDKNCAKK